MRVIIAGGGIGGLATALSLHQIGVPCRVYESAAEIKPLGVGINVLPHACRELIELGLGDRLAAIGVPTSELAYYTKRGQKIWSEPRGLAAGYHWPQYSIHRGELQQLLLDTARERLGAENILTGHHFVDAVDKNDGVSVTFRTNGGEQKVDGALLIGADGIHSALRQKFYPDEGPPIWNGRILWRGVTEGASYLTGRSMIMAGHQSLKFVCYPISEPKNGKQTINWIAESVLPPDHQWRREDYNRRAVLEEFLPLFESWRFDWLDVPQLIRNALYAYEYPMVDRDPLPRWTHGRATLLGDAAHPMYPIGSNGASQAILDARVLAREFRAHGVTPEALEAYEAERRPSTSQIVLLNRQNGPEQVMQLVEERAPQGFTTIDDVLSRSELEDVAANYKRVAGFQVDALNARPPIVPLT
ncbi:3-hydroxybenzoate 6-hydroxylase 1 [Variibacter gotjawalensis]|uniref:3-hydroxybenzoate 6-hydroxylase 1 n=1 Tax=Variibacter gotjawalensis TaxID=1333996 RepID=A0A0S3PQX3_9BRAD|nr:flavin-dependent oxidoreductase [Variibacter gotjawalensis]NIK48632.1 2-polyprenyl-6-methoxyphenol hydroxylase-like FAD-dependent oxidoreductase [Variibacter gotjawalensis]RZS50496.1 2-polyprenyl-6-methoxyphenol hydroxylase-like FAD-dependent oxidoreductase [Variibacter gotjawalensis]BAT58330.1 3-hydroxybenzoate 6-hydroxylase 1 [Variibacter gotjawalensis]